MNCAKRLKSLKCFVRRCWSSTWIGRKTKFRYLRTDSSHMTQSKIRKSITLKFWECFWKAQRFKSFFKSSKVFPNIKTFSCVIGRFFLKKVLLNDEFLIFLLFKIFFSIFSVFSYISKVSKLFKIVRSKHPKQFVNYI